MNVWIIKDGENLPLDSDTRLMRYGLLSESLLAKGHSVTWWASTFSHQKKTLLFDTDSIVNIAPNYTIRMLDCGGYKSNISLQRWIHHHRLAKRLNAEFKISELPNVIVCSFPIIETSFEAVQFAHLHNIPIILDVLDLWPDAYILKFPKLLRPIARLAFSQAFRKTKFALGNADSLIAVSDGWLNWSLRHARRERQTNDRIFCLGYKKTEFDEKTESKIGELLQRLEKKSIFVYTGTFSGGYNMKTIIAAANQLEVNASVHFVIAGIGDSYDATVKLTQGLSNITFTGWLDQPDLSYLLSRSYAGLLPWEFMRDGMPYKPFEYFASGLPIISSCEGDLETLIDKFQLGIHYQPGNVTSLVNAINHLVAHPEVHKRFSNHALQAFKQHFDARIIYEKYTSHIERVVQVKHRQMVHL